MAGSGRHHRRAISVLATIGLVAALVTVLTPATGVGATVHIYWAHSPGGIGRADINGSNIDQGFISTSRNQNASDVAVDANHIYWSSYGASTTISRADLDGSNIDEDFITLSHAGVASVAVDAAHIYWSSGALINGDHYTIGRANLDGSSVDENFITLTDRPSSLAVDANHIYWTIAVSGSGLDTIGRADLNGSGVDENFITGATYPGDVAVDSTHVYWTNNVGSSDMWIGRADLDGSNVDPNFTPTDKDGANGLAVDANNIYWANGGLETIGHALIDGTNGDQKFINFHDIAGTPRGIALDVGGAVGDTTAPTIMISRPEDGHSYTLGQDDVTTRGIYTCADEAGGTGLVSCVGDVPFDTPFDTSTAGTNISFTVTATDGAGNSATAVSHYDVLAGNLPPEPVPTSGGGFTTDPGNLGATTQVPVQTAIDVPASIYGGTLEVSSSPITLPPPSGYTFFGQQVNISSTTTGIAFDHPLVITFTIEGTTPGADPSTLTVVRTEAGVPTTLGLCTGAAGTASPDPCMTAPVRITSGPAAGDIQVSVYTTHASSWNVGTHAPFAYQGFLQPVDNPPTVNSSKAGSAIPVKFSLGSNQGLGILARGYPASQKVSCSSGAPIDEIEQTVTAGASSLSVSGAGQYTYTWKTDASWAGTCRTLTVKLADGSSHVAQFKFK